MKTKLFAILFAGLMVGGVAWGGEDESAEVSYPVADTPAQALENLRQSCIAGDKAQFLACFDVTAADVRLLSALFDLGRTVMDFKKKLVAKFGQEAVASFYAVAFGPLDDFIEIARGEVTISDDGNTATSSPAEDSYAEALDLVLTDGVWLAVVADMPTEEEDIEEALEMMQMETGVFRDMIDRVDDDDATIEQLKEELGEAVEAAFEAMVAEPQDDQ